MINSQDEIIILGGGLTGLSAGYVLANAGFSVRVFERDETVGGLSKTVVKDGFRFDLGGHRFFTKNQKIQSFVEDLMGEELISVPRKSKIYMRNRYFDYPLKPFNAMLGLGLGTTFEILLDYGVERFKRTMRNTSSISLEDWVVSNFGRKMFDIYFKEYSEKVWGIECNRISVDWVAQRIRGLSLTKAIKNAFLKFNGRDIPSLVDRFVYPKMGIGRISDRMSDEIDKGNRVFTQTDIERINHSDFKIKSIEVNDGLGSHTVEGTEFISSIPLTHLVKILHPAPPEAILSTASKLKYRDLVIVTIMFDRERVTDQTWIYIPEKTIPFGRIHEPTNWSEKMAPDGKTLLVVEYFSFIGDAFWNEKDERLVAMTVEHLERLGFIGTHEVIDSTVVRVPRAYPLFETGYKERCDEIYNYLGNFRNLHIAGRSGMFRYYNMDHALESGMTTAEDIIRNRKVPRGNREVESVSAGNTQCDVRS